MMRLAAAFLFLGLNLYVYYFLATEAVIPPRRSFEEFPLKLEDGWSCAGQETIEDKVLRNLGVTDYLLCDFRNDETADAANVYVGYHATQVREEGGGAAENSIHPPAHCLPGSGWDIVQNETIQLEAEGLPGGRGEVKRLVIAKGPYRQLVYYWYQSRGRVIADDWKKVLFVGLDRATRNRTDGSLVRFTMPVYERERGEGNADEVFRSLAPLVLARLDQYVPE